MKIDLHAHSIRSDGKDSPTEVFEHAAAAGVEVLALTDHDTTSGWTEAAEAASRLGMTFVPGIEVTTRSEVLANNRRRFISVHLLAYLPDPNNEKLQSAMSQTVNFRENRAKLMVERLAEDFPITWDLVLAQLAEGATIGRPAIADAMVELGLGQSRSEVFRGPLHKDSKYYVSTETLDFFDAIGLVRDAGGVPVIAHPLGGAPEHLERGDLPEEHFEAAIEAGLAGFEVFHREVPQVAREWLLGLAQKHDLIVTGSSDYHGEHGKPNRLGENTTAPEMYQRIVETASGSKPLN